MYTPLHVHTHYSLLDGLSKPEQIANRCKKLNFQSCAITDHGTISGNVDFYKTMKKSGIKPILGCELYITKDASNKSKENKSLSHLVVLCKNYQGWQDLIKLVSLSNASEYFYHKPRLDMGLIKGALNNNQNLICISGHPGSTLANEIYDFQTNDLINGWQDKAKEHVCELQDVFGADNFYIEIQLMDIDNEDQQNIGKNLRKFAIDNNIQRVATIDAHYCEMSDAVDQRVLLCSSLKTTLPEISQKIVNNEKVPLSTFFTSERYYILSSEEMSEIHDKEELDNTLKIDQQCEEYDILLSQLPDFACPDNQTPIEYIRQLCRDGWKQKIQNKIPKEQHQIYIDRVKKEFDVLESANLASYFLIVRDIVNYVRSKNCLPGPGRGSAAGCLVSYLIGITAIDPIRYDLIFERFYNAGRNTEKNISMPDIDVDVPIEHREDIINYIKSKYGHDKVSQMITFNTLKGRGALKEVLRVYGNISFQEMNKITKNIPDEAKIADELQEMKDENGEASIIRWALENNANKLKEWCYLDDNNELQGPLSKRFEQAIRLEGSKYNQSKHAAGIAIANNKLSSICPMLWDTKTKQNIAGFEMSDLESIGVIKFDILGIALLDKIMYAKTSLLQQTFLEV